MAADICGNVRLQIVVDHRFGRAASRSEQKPAASAHRPRSSVPMSTACTVQMSTRTMQYAR